VSTKAKVFIGIGVYFAIAILMLLIFGSSGKTSLSSHRTSSSSTPGYQSTCEASTSASTRRFCTWRSPAP